MLLLYLHFEIYVHQAHRRADKYQKNYPPRNVIGTTAGEGVQARGKVWGTLSTTSNLFS